MRTDFGSKVVFKSETSNREQKLNRAKRAVKLTHTLSEFADHQELRNVTATVRSSYCTLLREHLTRELEHGQDPIELLRRTRKYSNV